MPKKKSPHEMREIIDYDKIIFEFRIAYDSSKVSIRLKKTDIFASTPESRIVVSQKTEIAKIKIRKLLLTLKTSCICIVKVVLSGPISLPLIDHTIAEC